MSKKMTLTSVKVPSDLFEEFKISSIRYKFTLQKLTERAIYQYLTNEEFRKTIHSTLKTDLQEK